MLKHISKYCRNYPKPLLGDWLIIIAAIITIIFLFKFLWIQEDAAKLRVRLGNQVYGVFSLAQDKTMHIKGHLGLATIQIQQGRVRFQQSPCHNQYCVHQGWLKRAGQAAICLPNQISLELLGTTNTYDTLNY